MIFQNKKTYTSTKVRRRFSNLTVYLILILISMIWLFPLFGLFLESFRVESPAQQSYLWPKQFGFDNYIRLFQKNSRIFLRKVHISPFRYAIIRKMISQEELP